MTHKKARGLFRRRMSPAQGGNGFDGPTSPVVERSREPVWVDPVARLTGGGSHWTGPRAVDLRALVAGLDLGAFFSGNVMFCTDFTTSPCHVWADPEHLEEMIIVLVLNAREAVGSRGTVRLAVDHLSGMTVEGEIRDGWVQLEVADSGEGTDPEFLARILRYHFTTRSSGEDPRIGLSVACGTVRQNGAGMNLTSEPGRKTVVRVWFPSVRE